MAVLLVASVSLPAAAETRLLAFGDSLTSGWGLAARDAFPAALERALHAAGRRDVRVIAGGVAGDTTA
ncbi:MAG: arylesterase, partial [Defluviicoccus sp.]|nr:arylesterase [Defluviicoccus sp.]